MNTDRFYTRSFAEALWLSAKGFEPLTCAPARNGGGIVFSFPPAAGDAAAEFHQTKARLSEMTSDALQAKR